MPQKNGWKTDVRLARIAEVISDGCNFYLYARLWKHEQLISFKNGIRLLLDQNHYILSFKKAKPKQPCFLTSKEQLHLLAQLRAPRFHQRSNPQLLPCQFLLSLAGYEHLEVLYQNAYKLFYSVSDYLGSK